MKGCKFVQRSEVNDALVYFDLLDTEDLKKIRDDDEEDEGAGGAGPRLPSLEPLQTKNSNQLAQGCLKLLSSLELSDMQFVLHQQDATPLGQDEDTTNTSSISEPVVLSAHRVIVAARCEWLKRALMSGMREAIDRYVCKHRCML